MLTPTSSLEEPASNGRLGSLWRKTHAGTEEKKPLVMWHQPARIGPKTTTFASTTWIIENSFNLSLKRLSAILCKALAQRLACRATDESFFPPLKVIFFTFKWGPVTEGDAVYDHAVTEVHNGKPAFQHQRHQQLQHGHIVQCKRVPPQKFPVCNPTSWMQDKLRRSTLPSQKLLQRLRSTAGI